MSTCMGQKRLVILLNITGFNCLIQDSESAFTFITPGRCYKSIHRLSPSPPIYWRLFLWSFICRPLLWYCPTRGTLTSWSCSSGMCWLLVFQPAAPSSWCASCTLPPVLWLWLVSPHPLREASECPLPSWEALPLQFIMWVSRHITSSLHSPCSPTYARGTSAS